VRLLARTGGGRKDGCDIVGNRRKKGRTRREYSCRFDSSQKKKRSDQTSIGGNPGKRGKGGEIISVESKGKGDVRGGNCLCWGEKHDWAAHKREGEKGEGDCVLQKGRLMGGGGTSL